MKKRETNNTANAEESQKNQGPEESNNTSSEPQKTLATVEVSEAGYLIAKTIEGKFRIANAFFLAGMVPKSYKDAGSVFAGMELAVQLGLPPLVGLRHIAVINGQPSIWGELPLALCRRAGLIANIEEFVFDANYEEICFANGNLGAEVWGAVCRIMRTGSQGPHETFFTLDDAKRAGLMGRDNVWKTYPRRMLQMRARSQNLKDTCPDALMGIAISEYDFNYLPKDVTPKNVGFDGVELVDPVEKLNQLIGGENAKNNKQNVEKIDKSEDFKNQGEKIN